MSGIAEAQRWVAAKHKEILIDRTLNIPVEFAWKAWTESETFKKWWGPKDFKCPYSSIDLQQGGKYLHCMRSSLGERFWSTGHYNEIVPLKKLVFTDSFSDNKGNIIPAADLNLPGKWPMMLLISLSFERMGDTTRMFLRHEGIPSELSEECIRGWNQSFDKMEAIAEW